MWAFVLGLVVSIIITLAGVMKGIVALVIIGVLFMLSFGYILSSYYNLLYKKVKIARLTQEYMEGTITESGYADEVGRIKATMGWFERCLYRR